MKRFILLCIVSLITLSVKAQEENLKVLGLQLENYEYPFEVKKLVVNNQNQELEFAYMDVRPQNSNNKNVLLLHGKNFNGAYWETTIEALSREGYRVIVPDQIGFGKSSKPENFQYSFQQLAMNTKNLLDSLGVSKVAVVGHSMGGMLATRFALMFPGVTEKLILVNPIGLEDYKRKVPYQPISSWYENELEQDYKKIKEY